MSLDTNSSQLKNLLVEINALPDSTEVGATNILNYINEEMSSISTNKFDKSKYTNAVILDNNTGAIITNSSYCSTGYIHCRKGQKILISRGTGSTNPIVRSIEYFDINKNRIEWKSSTSVSTNGFTNIHLNVDRPDAIGTNNVDGSYYIRIYFPVYDLNTYQVQIFDNHFEVSGAATELQNYNSFVSIENPLENKNFWYDKTIAFDGDSITYGYSNAQRSYAHYCCEALGCNIINTAIGGSTLAVKSSNPTERDPLIDRYTNMGEADTCVINIGSNDWQYSWTPFGDMSSNDKYTFYGALKLLCQGLLEKYSGKPLVFCTPIKRVQGDGLAYYEQNSYGKTLKDYADAIKEVCGYYGIPVLDLYSECLINPIISSHNTAYFASADGTHPNAVGHTILARRLKGYLKQLSDSVRE